MKSRIQDTNTPTAKDETSYFPDADVPTTPSRVTRSLSNYAKSTAINAAKGLGIGILGGAGTGFLAAVFLISAVILKVTAITIPLGTLFAGLGFTAATVGVAALLTGGAALIVGIAVGLVIGLIAGIAYGIYCAEESHKFDVALHRGIATAKERKAGGITQGVDVINSLGGPGAGNENIADSNEGFTLPREGDDDNMPIRQLRQIRQEDEKAFQKHMSELFQECPKDATPEQNDTQSTNLKLKNE